MVRTIILAAGASSRMGRPKPTLPLDGRGDTFLTRLLRTFAAAGLPEIVVVTGAHALTPGRSWPHQRVRLVANPQWREGQLSSLKAGLTAPSHAPLEAAVVTLVDVPLVTVETVSRLVSGWRSTRAPIVRPARSGEHGHPVIFDSSLFGELLEADSSAGAKPVVHAHLDEILNLPIDDPGAYQDVDTPQDYHRIIG